MRVLLIGSGGREHALAWALSRSPLLTALYAAPGNPGIAEVATCVAADPGDPAEMIDICRAESIDLVVIGPEAPLAAGLADALEAAGIRCFGPTKAAARLEGSKGFTKDLCRAAGIPTASYARFDDLVAARAYVERHALPVVVKADGLAAGKGVTVAASRDEALAALDAIFGAPNAQVVVEEFLTGDEASLFVLTDGHTILPFGTAQDHKRAFDGDTGPNTGGMGAISPAPCLDGAMVERALAEIVQPTLAALLDRGIVYRGVLYAGLMITAEGPKLIEYNVRFGDPECQALMLRLADDLLPILDAVARGALDRTAVRWREDSAVCVVLASRGYPGPYPTGSELRGLEKAGEVAGAQVFHAGTRRAGDRILAAGGRVLNVAALGPSVEQARAKAYEAVARIDWPGGFCRTDIGRSAARAMREKRQS
jgi:phosphoribosylamine--glycine ligase